MRDFEIDIQTPDGAMNTFVTCPDEGGPFPVVLFLMDAPGKREELHDMARRLGTSGYYVILPNLYYRMSRDFVMTSRDEMVRHMDSLSNQMVINDCERLLDWSASEADAGEGPAGVVGYCMSGPFAFSLAGQIPERVVAGASLHGIRLITDADDSPHLTAANIAGEFYIGCAETDHWAPREMIDDLQQYLEEQKANVRVEWYPGTEHGFVFPDRAEKYHKASAERHWERLLTMFERQRKHPQQ